MIGFAREAKALGRLRALPARLDRVRGRRATTGTFRERQLDAGQEFRNTYEQTKWEAEQHRAPTPTTSRPAIARPSIVMGESDSGWTPAFNVLYWPLRAFSRGLFDAVPALADGRVDVVPVDYVADGIVHLLDRAEAGVFNLVAGPRRADGRRARSSSASRRASTAPRPELVEPGGRHRAADEHGAVYLPYFDMEVVFDDSRARERARPAGIRAPRLADYFGRADRLRGGRALGQAPDERRGRARAAGAGGRLDAERRRDRRDHPRGRLLELEPGDPENAITGGKQARIAAAVTLERGAAAVIGEPVDLDDQALPRPQDVHLVALDADVGPWRRHSGGAHRPAPSREVGDGRGRCGDPQTLVDHMVLGPQRSRSMQADTRPRADPGEDDDVDWLARPGLAPGQRHDRRVTPLHEASSHGTRGGATRPRPERSVLRAAGARRTDRFEAAHAP